MTLGLFGLCDSVMWFGLMWNFLKNKKKKKEYVAVSSAVSTSKYNHGLAK